MAQERLALVDLIDVYRAASAAALVVDGAIEAARAEQGRDVAALVRRLDGLAGKAAGLRDAVFEEMRRAPVRSRGDALQKLRFELLEYGSCGAEAERLVRAFFRDGGEAPKPPLIPTKVGISYNEPRRLKEVPAFAGTSGYE